MVGQIARDLVLVVDEVPGSGGTVPVRERREMLGGKGANIAVGLAQLGAPVRLVGVVGDDDTGARLIARAAADGIGTEAVVQRQDCATGLIVDLVADGWRYLEHLPDGVLLREDDVPTDLIARAATVVVQLQQPPEVALKAARAAHGRVVLDGAPERLRAELLACADVVRADHQEAELLSGRKIADAAGQHIGIVSEMIDVRNRNLAAVTRADDFVVSNKLVSLMLAQASENELMAQIFGELLDEDGSEIYMRPVTDYIAVDRPVNFYTVTLAALIRGEVAIGYSRTGGAGNGHDPRNMGGVVVNPAKSEKLTFDPSDRLIILARQ